MARTSQLNPSYYARVVGATRIAIGHYASVDDDRVCLTNLNRLLHAIRMSVLRLIIAGEVIKDLTKTWREE